MGFGGERRQRNGKRQPEHLANNSSLRGIRSTEVLKNTAVGVETHRGGKAKVYLRSQGSREAVARARVTFSVGSSVF